MGGRAAEVSALQIANIPGLAENYWKYIFNNWGTRVSSIGARMFLLRPRRAISRWMDAMDG